MVFIQSSGQLQTTTLALRGGSQSIGADFIRKSDSINRLRIVIDDVIAIVVVRKLNEYAYGNTT